MSLGATDTAFNFDALFYGDFDVVTDSITVKSGSNLLRGTVLGRVMSASTATSAANAGNTGNGTMGVITVSAGAQPGTYKLFVIAAAANAGTFSVEDPSGQPVGEGTVAVAFSKGGIAFTLADGATDFAVGDGFSIIVVAAGFKSVAVNSANTDGTEAPYAVLAQDTDATSADTVAPAYI